MLWGLLSLNGALPYWSSLLCSPWSRRTRQNITPRWSRGDIFHHNCLSPLNLALQILVKCRSSKATKPKHRMTIADLILLNLFMTDNEKCNISHAPSTGLCGTQFSMLNVLESLSGRTAFSFLKSCSSYSRQLSYMFPFSLLNFLFDLFCVSILSHLFPSCPFFLSLYSLIRWALDIAILKQSKNA